MLRFTRSGRPYVLRRGPKHLRPRSNVVIMRETQVLAALAGTDVPHPRLIASCDDPGVLGDAVFYLMEPIDGFNAGQELPELHAADPAVRFEMGLSMADALAKLGAVDYAAVGLSDYGKPDGFLERQVPRWLSELESYKEFENYPGPDIPGVDDVASVARRGPSDGVDTGHHARRLPRGQCDVLPHRPRGRRDRRLGDVHDRRSAAGPRLAAGHVGTVRRVRRQRFSRRADWPPPATWSSATPATPPATCRTSPGTPCWPASNSASCWRARTPGPAPARPRRRSATCSTRPPCDCSSRR